MAFQRISSFSSAVAPCLAESASHLPNRKPCDEPSRSSSSDSNVSSAAPSSFTTALLFALSPEVRRANEERLVRKSYDAMVEAGLDAATYPFSLYFDHYKFEGAVAVMMVVSVLDTLMADGKDDEHIVPMIFARLDAWFDDHGNPFEINERTTALREKLLEGAR